MVAEIIDVRLRHKPGQWFIATSEKLPGLFISHPDRDAVISDIPVTIKALFKEQYGIDVKVVEVNNPNVDDEIPWIALLPKDLPDEYKLM